jgi:hypothetical protein
MIMRARFSIAVLAWVTAVLVTAPVLAARSCLDCCAARSQTVRTPACQHCPTGRASLLVSDKDCHGCPKCESARPLPVMRAVSVAPWQPSELLAATLGQTVPTTKSSVVSAVLSAALASRASSPPLQILYCTWLN